MSRIFRLANGKRYVPRKDDGKFILGYRCKMHGDHAFKNRILVEDEEEVLRLLRKGDYGIWMMPEGGKKGQASLISPDSVAIA